MNKVSIAGREIESVLRKLISGFCFHPEHLTITVTIYPPNIVNVRIQGHATDTPRIIGEDGEMFRSLAKIAQAIGRRHDVGVIFSDVQQPVIGEEKPYPRFEAKADWPRETLLMHIKQASAAVFFYPKITHEDINEKETVVQIQVQEEIGTVKKLREALPVVFNAIGRMNGRILTVIVSQAEAQPGRADGRHAKEAAK